MAVSTAALLLLAAAGCKEENQLVAPPPPRIGVAAPAQQQVTPHIEATGSVAAVNSTDLMARVAGTLAAIDYQDGARVRKGDLLFTIDPAEYEAKLQQAQAALANSEAQLVQAEAELQRQVTLGRQAWAAQSTIDQQRALRDGLRATIAGQQAGIALAQLDLGYTRVTAPFDGVVSARLYSVGALVGMGGPTRLATITQLDPIWVTFTISEQDALRIRAQVAERGGAPHALGQVPVEVGLMTEQGFPHRGRLDYITPQFDASSGTLTLRAVLENPQAALVPGGFVRVRVPTGPAQTALLVPDQALGTDQGGRYALVVDGQDVVRQRRVRAGALLGPLRVVEAGLEPTDRVVVSRLQRAVPGTRVEPQPVAVAGGAAGDALAQRR